MNERKINGRSPWSPRLPSSPPRKKPVAGIFCALRRLFFATKSFGRRGKNYDGEDFDCADGGFLLRVVDAGRNGLRESGVHSGSTWWGRGALTGPFRNPFCLNL